MKAIVEREARASAVDDDQRLFGRRELGRGRLSGSIARVLGRASVLPFGDRLGIES